MVIFKEKVSNKKKEKLWKNAYLIHQLARDFLTISYTSEDGKEINEAFDASFRTGLNEAVAPYRQLYVFHIIRFFVESLEAIEGIFRGQQFYEIPDFGDIFRVFYNDDSYMRGRKTIELV